MTVSGGFAIERSASVTACGASLSCAGKPSKTQDYRRDRRRGDEDARKGARDRRRGASRNDTTADASFWNGPRLRAPFVAQVIGQVIGENAPDAQSALASYTQAEPLHLFCDRSV